MSGRFTGIFSRHLETYTLRITSPCCASHRPAEQADSSYDLGMFHLGGGMRDWVNEWSFSDKCVLARCRTANSESGS